MSRLADCEANAASDQKPPRPTHPPIDGWESFLHDGEGYLKTALAAHEKRNRVFTPEILFNVAAMAIEKFFMAALMCRGELPMNHTMADMIPAMEEVFPGAVADIREAVLALDTYQQICDPWAYSITPPNAEEIPGILSLAQKIHTLVADELVTNSA